MAAAATSRCPLGRGSLWPRHRRAITAALALLIAAAFAHYVLPHIVGLGPTLRRLRHGHLAWLAVGVALEACSLFGEVALFRGVFARPGNRIGWTTSAEITLAGAAATRLVAAAGAGGVAVTVWGLRAMGCGALRWRTAWSASESSPTGSTSPPSRSPGSASGLGYSVVPLPLA